MSDQTITLNVPADCFERDRRAGFNRVGVDVWCPREMTPERFREVAAAKAAKLQVSCYEWAPQRGPVLQATYMEDGVKVVLHGPVDPA